MYPPAASERSDWLDVDLWSSVPDRPDVDWGSGLVGGGLGLVGCLMIGGDGDGGQLVDVTTTSTWFSVSSSAATAMPWTCRRTVSSPHTADLCGHRAAAHAWPAIPATARLRTLLRADKARWQRTSSRTSPARGASVVGLTRLGRAHRGTEGSVVMGRAARAAGWAQIARNLCSA